MSYDFRRKVGTLILTVLFVFSATFAFGQGISTGSISGVVEDQQHAVISGAKVSAKLVGTDQQFNTTSSEGGLFSLRSLPVGTYTVTIEAAKFSKLQITNVAVSSSRDTSLAVRTLTIGTTEVVTVEGTAPLVESNSSQVLTSFTTRKVTDLPIGNGFDALALLVPGVAGAGDQGFSNTNGADISSNGQRGRSNNFQIDGQSNNDNSVAGPSFFFGNQDAIAEFQIITNNFSAEYGRNMGSVVNYVTKSGSNSIHGTVFWFHTNAYTDSLSNDEKSELFGFCAPGQNPDPDGVPFTGDECVPPTQPKYIENRQGFTLGGPIIKNKAWFFGSYMYDRVAAEAVGSSGSNITPTEAGLTMLAATYCAGVVPSCPSHPGLGALLTNGPYANPLGNPHISSAITTLNVTDGVTPLAGVPFSSVERRIPNPFKDHELSGRVDIQLSQKDRLFARYIFQDAYFGVSGRVSAGAWVDVPGRTQQIGLDWVRNWTNTFINQVRFSYSRAKFTFGGQAGGKFANCTVADVLSCPTGINMPGGFLDFGQQNNLPQDRLVNNSQWQDNATWVHGKHTFKFGGEYARQRSPNNFLPNQLGTFNFPASQGFNGLLRNIASSLALTGGSQLFNFKEQDVSLYFQDDWRIKDNLTLNLGIRWEMNQQAINLLHNLTVARESDPTTAFWDTTMPVEDRTVPAVSNDMNNWSPNVGFAWTPRIWEGFFGRDKTVIRGGFRIAYDPAFYNIFANVATVAPTVNAASLTAGLCTTVCRQVPAGTAYSGAEVQAARLPFMPLGVDPGFRTQTQVTRNFHNPYTEQWSLGVQRQVTPKIAFEIRYSGNHTVGNFQTINGNPLVNGPGAFGGGTLAADFPSEIPAGVTGCTDATRPGFLEGRADCDFRLVRTRANSAWAIYHALQTRLDFQSWHGLTAGAAYTFSRSIDNVSEIFSTFGGGTTIAGAQNAFDNNRAERGVSGLSYPHVASFYWIYDLPWYKSQQGFAGHVLGGWQVNGVWRYRSGQSVAIGQFFGNSYCDLNFSITFFGADTCRPILSNPGAPIDTVGQCLNTCTGGDFVDFFTGLVTSPDAVHWIFNDDTASLALGSPFLGSGRNTFRGQTVNNVDFSVYKNTKITERVTVQFQANAFNVLNRQFRGNPDPFIDDFPASLGGSFGNNFFNGSNRRRMTFGLKLVF